MTLPRIDSGYSTLNPNLQLGLPFKPMAVSADWHDWPSLIDLFPVSFPGVQTGRDRFLIDTDINQLRARVADYFNAELSHDEITRRYPYVMNDTARYGARSVRDVLLGRGNPTRNRFLPLRLQAVRQPMDILGTGDEAIAREEPSLPAACV